MAHADASRRRGVRGLADQANPAFAAGVVVVPVGALAAVLLAGDLRLLNYVHVMAGGLWTGIDVFMASCSGRSWPAWTRSRERRSSSGSRRR